MKKQLQDLIRKALLDARSNIEPAVLMAFIAVESSGSGFDQASGRMLIQFEPKVFSEKTGIPRSKENHYKWDENRIERQPAEWEAFNDAAKVSREKAQESTSIGLPQIMGYHWKRLGFRDVGHMWSYFERGEAEQIRSLILFINSDARLKKAVLSKDWHHMAYYYNGAKYREQAAALGIVPYDQQMATWYTKFTSKMG